MDDLARLRQDYPGWSFGSVWATAASGPDARRLWASRDGMLLTAWTAAELARDIDREEQAAPRRLPGTGRPGAAGPPGRSRPGPGNMCAFRWF